MSQTCQRCREKNDALITALNRLVNLSSHPLFIEQKELLSWDGAVVDARDALNRALSTEPALDAHGRVQS